MIAKKRALFLWDIDGTLLITGGAGMRAMKRTGAALFGDGLCWDGIRVSGGLDPVILHEVLTATGIEPHHDHHRAFHDRYLGDLRAELEQSRESLRQLPGVARALRALDERARRAGDVVQALVTGNYTAAAPIKLDAVGIDRGLFAFGAFGDEGKTRPDLVALALRRFEAHTGEAAEPRRTVVIGDTPRDIACAHAHGCVAFAVATGEFSVDALRAAGADHVAANLADPSPLLALAG